MDNEEYGIFNGNGEFLRRASEAERSRENSLNEYFVPLRVCSGSSSSKFEFVFARVEKFVRV